MEERRSIRINRTSILIYFLLIFGAGLIYGGIYLVLHDYPSPGSLGALEDVFSQQDLQVIVIGFGLFLVTLFVYLYFVSRYQKLTLDQTKPFLIIHEKVRGQTLEHEIDFEDFTHIEVVMEIDVRKRKGGKASKAEVLTVTLFRNNGTSLSLYNKSYLSKNKLSNLSYWMEYLPLKCEVVCEIPKKRQKYFEFFKQLPDVKFLNHRVTDSFPILLRNEEKVRYQLPKKTNFKKIERYIPEHERIITLLHWTKTKDIPANLFGFSFFSFFSFIFIRSLIYDFSLIVFLLLLFFMSMALYAAYYIYQIFHTYDRAVFGVKGIAYARVWSKENPATDFTTMPYQDIHSFWGLINGQGFFYVNNQKGHKDLISRANLGGVMKLDVKRILYNVGLLKKGKGKKIEDRVTDFSDELVYIEDKYMMLDMKHFSIGERLFFEELILSKIESA